MSLLMCDTWESKETAQDLAADNAGNSPSCIFRQETRRMANRSAGCADLSRTLQAMTLNLSFFARKRMSPPDCSAIEIYTNTKHERMMEKISCILVSFYLTTCAFMYIHTYIYITRTRARCTCNTRSRIFYSHHRAALRAGIFTRGISSRIIETRCDTRTAGYFSTLPCTLPHLARAHSCVVCNQFRRLNVVKCGKLMWPAVSAWTRKIAARVRHIAELL